MRQCALGVIVVGKYHHLQTAGTRIRLPMPIRELRRQQILHVWDRWATVSSWSKKGAQLPSFRTTLLTPNPEDSTSTTLEVDELWSFVLKKANDSWMWIALCRKMCQVGGYTGSVSFAQGTFFGSPALSLNSCSLAAKQGAQKIYP